MMPSIKAASKGDGEDGIVLGLTSCRGRKLGESIVRAVSDMEDRGIWEVWVWKVWKGDL